MKKVILSVLAGLVPIQILWLSGHNLTRSPELAYTSACSFFAALFVLAVLTSQDSEKK
jgi:hypothetical protein